MSDEETGTFTKIMAVMEQIKTKVGKDNSYSPVKLTPLDIKTLLTEFEDNELADAFLILKKDEFQKMLESSRPESGTDAWVPS